MSRGENYEIIAHKESRNGNVITSSDSQHISVVYCTNVRGYSLEPCFILKGTNQTSPFINYYKTAGFYEPLVLTSYKAFMNYDCFNEWVKYFIKNGKFNPSRYSTLIHDGHLFHTMHVEALPPIFSILEMLRALPRKRKRNGFEDQQEPRI